MKLKAVAAVAISAMLAAGAATVGASTPPDTDPTGFSSTDDGSSSTSAATEAPTTAVESTVTISVETEAPPADGTTVGPETTSATTATAAETSVVSSTNPGQSDQSQNVVITATVVADANTGSNLVGGDGSGTGSSVPAEIDTGDATAVGSNDENVVRQGAEVVLTDSATANLLQVALVINIGAALANSGLNAVTSSPGGSGTAGDIASGDATATGLDIDQYITQVARQNADADNDASSSQVAISLWMGVATANSGTNAVVGTGVAGSGGAVGSGDATATGNDSLTEIEQYAGILGVDQSTTNITQRATVLNVGFALANSGLNQVSDVASGLLSASEADDDAVAQQLFAMLLPAMLQSYGYGPAQGSVTSGDATAVGNDSETFVRQVALAASSGDGQIDIVQDVLVANMGAAAANTGGNSLGAVRPLDQETADAVVTMAAFMAEMLSLVHRSANSTALAAHSQGIEIPFQGLILRLDGAFQGLDTEVGEGGAQANVRQVSVIVSLGIAQANSGGNVTQSDVQQGAAVNALRVGDAVAVLAVDANGNVITTGDAAAGNREVVVVCQRLNADDVDCLAPPTTTTPVSPPTTIVGPATTGGGPATSGPPVATGVTEPPGGGTSVPPPAGPTPFGPPVTVPTGMLPATGQGSIELLAIAITALLLGGALVVVTRERSCR